MDAGPPPRGSPDGSPKDAKRDESKASENPLDKANRLLAQAETAAQARREGEPSPRAERPAADNVEFLPLWRFFQDDQWKAAEEFIKDPSVDVNIRDDIFGWTPLHFAANGGALDLYKSLVGAKAKVDMTCREGNTALMMACRRGHARMVEYMIAKKANLDAQNKLGWTPIIWSSINGHEEVTTMLIQAHASYLHADGEGRTPCMWLGRTHATPPPAMPFTTLKSYYWPDYRASMPSMEGKVFAITGCTSGTGLTLAIAVAELKAKVLLLNRPSARAEAALAQVKAAAETAGGPEPVAIACDLLSFAKTRAAGEELKKVCGSGGLDVLCNNAGIMGNGDDATEDGVDVQMCVNHLAAFLLTKYAMPCLEKAASLRGEARVVQHSSALRCMDEKGWENKLKAKYLEKNGGNLGGTVTVYAPGGPNYQRYQQSKLANVVFTYALNDRLKAKGSKVKALVAHPGVAPTSLHGGADPGRMMRCLAWMIMHSEEDGTMGLAMCCCDPNAKSGEFYGPAGKGLQQAHDSASYKGKAVLLPEVELADAEAREMLWRVSNETTGAGFKL